jgi:plastocyanin
MTRIIQKSVLFSAVSAAVLLLLNGCASGPSPIEPGLSDAETPTVPRLAALTMSASAESRNQAVTIDNFSFTPATITIAAGQSITWVNHDDVPHTVTANDKSFTSKTLDTDDRYSRTFAVPGVYPYFCAVHPHMTGKIIVK